MWFFLGSAKRFDSKPRWYDIRPRDVFCMDFSCVFACMQERSCGTTKVNMIDSYF